jgi:ATP-dependent Zn protease
MGGAMSNSKMLIDLLINWFPMLLLIGVWIFFMRQMRGANSPQQQAFAEQKRHNDALEKILASHEARLQKIEGDKERKIAN